MSQSPFAEGGRLVDNIVHFGRVLRRAGMPVGPAAIIEAVRAVEAAGIERRDDFYWTLHSVLVTRRDQRLIFDEAFHTFWRSRGILDKMIQMLSPMAHAAPPERRAAQRRVAEALSAGRRQETPQREPIEIEATFTVSGREMLQSKDFEQMTAAELAEATARVRRLATELPKVRVRRMVPAPHGRLVDPRRTLRGSLRAGGATIPLAFRDRREAAPPVVALLDISGSMSRYTRVVLHFLHALTAAHGHVSTFVFGTRLTNITRQLDRKDPDEALAGASSAVRDWSGGTRIATALEEFNRLWSRRVMHGGPIVLLVTDGLERDDADDLARAADRLHRSCRRLIWLNPLLRFQRFEPKAHGIKALLPHVDEFRPVHSLEAVADLCRALATRQHDAAYDPRRWTKAPPMS